MSVLTLAEVKKILRITTSYKESEQIAFASLERHNLTYKPATVLYVCGDTALSSLSTYYTTADYHTSVNYAGVLRIKRISDTSAMSTGTTAYITYSYCDYDELINYLIPKIEKEVCEYCNNYFEDYQTTVTVAPYEFISKGTTNAQLASTTNYFLLYGFTSTMDVTIRGSQRNSGLYHLTSAAAGRVLIGDSEDFTGEKSTALFGGQVIQVNRIRWPEELKTIISQIIWYNIDRAKTQAITSRSLGPSSISYATITDGNYPPSMLRALDKYRKARMI